jgi:hypothetical protein
MEPRRSAGRGHQHEFLSIGNDSGGSVLHFNAGDINVAAAGDFFV